MQSERYTNTTPSGTRKSLKKGKWKSSHRCGDQLDNRLQLASVAYRVLDDRAARHQDVLLRPGRGLRLDWEVYPSVTENPPSLLSELNNSSLGVEEQEILGVGNGKRRIRFLGTVRDFTSDGSNKDLLITESLAIVQQQAKRAEFYERRIDSR